MPIPQCKRGIHSDALYNKILNLTKASITELPSEIQEHAGMIAMHIFGRLQDDVFVAQIAQQYLVERARIQANTEHPHDTRALLEATTRPIPHAEILHTMDFLRMNPEHFTRVALRNFRDTFNTIYNTIDENLVHIDHINVFPAVIRILQTFFNLQNDTAQPTIDPTLQPEDIAVLRGTLPNARAFTQVMLDRHLVDFNDRELEDIFYDLDETPGPTTTPIEGRSTPRAQQRENMVYEQNTTDTPQTTTITFTRGTPNTDEDEYREILEILGFYNTPVGFTLTIPVHDYATRTRPARLTGQEEADEELFFFADEENGTYGIDTIPFDLPTDGSTFDRENNEVIQEEPVNRRMGFDDEEQEESARSD